MASIHAVHSACCGRVRGSAPVSRSASCVNPRNSASLVRHCAHIHKPFAAGHWTSQSRKASEFAAQAMPSFVEISELSLSAPSLVAGGAVLAISGIAGWRFYLYSQLEYITASMLTRYVPKVTQPGARVLQLGGGTKELFYYPKGTGLVTVVREDANAALYDQAGIQAQVGVLTQKQSAAQLQFAAGSSVDAVVAISSLGKLPQDQLSGALQEIHRVLKPGSPLIFIEPVEEGSSALRPVLGTTSGFLGEPFFSQLKDSPRFDTVSWDVALQGQDPHAAGIAVKAVQAAEGRRQPRNKSKNSSTAGFTT